MSAQALAAGFLALFPGDVVKHDGQVVEADGTVPRAPWVHVSIGLPAVSERAQARVGHLYRVTARCLVYGGTTASVRIIAQKVDDAVEGATPDVPGWKCSPVEQVNTREPVQDRDVKITATNQHPMFGVLEYLFTASPTEG